MADPVKSPEPEPEVLSVSNLSLPDEDEDEDDLRGHRQEQNAFLKTISEEESQIRMGSDQLLRGLERRSNSPPVPLAEPTGEWVDDCRQTIADKVLCPLCEDILVEPVVTPCGHAFCRTCLDGHLILTHENTCPLDQEPLPDYLAVCQQLKTLIEYLYPLETSRHTAQMREEEGKLWAHLEELVTSHKSPTPLPAQLRRRSKSHRSSAGLLQLLEVANFRTAGSSLPRHLDKVTTIDEDSDGDDSGMADI